MKRAADMPRADSWPRACADTAGLVLFLWLVIWVLPEPAPWLARLAAVLP